MRWKQKLLRGCLGALIPCLGPVAVAHNGGTNSIAPDPIAPDPIALVQAPANTHPPIAMWRCGRVPPPGG